MEFLQAAKSVAWLVMSGHAELSPSEEEVFSNIYQTLISELHMIYNVTTISDPALRRIPEKVLDKDCELILTKNQVREINEVFEREWNTDYEDGA